MGAIDSTDLAGTHEVVSIDGRTFTCRIPLDLGLLAGDLAVIDSQGRTRMLGQVLDLELDGRLVICRGRLLADVGDDGTLGALKPRPFGGGALQRAPKELVEAFDRWAKADLVVGTVRVDDGSVPATLRADGFNRHTFVCGQSGSGKTYALGVVLERVLAYTDLKMVIIDPNADYVRLGEVRPEATGDAADRMRRVPVEVLRSGSAADEPGARPLTVNFRELSRKNRAALLRVDPMADREEYSALRRILTAGDLKMEDAQEYFALLSANDDPVSLAIAQRLENLGLLDLSVWSRGRLSCVSQFHEAERAVVMDVSGFSDPRERSIAALSLLDDLWANRESREPVLIVIDEAHNLCTAEPADALEEAVTDRLVQIAAEGRKYGLWLLLSTQRPSKIHPNVLSQCDNLMMMRMNSPGDVAELGAVFGFAPPSLLAAAPTFGLGETLLAGRFSPLARIAKMGERLTYQGGADVDVPRSAD